jgi:hypothetical protein
MSRAMFFEAGMCAGGLWSISSGLKDKDEYKANRVMADAPW